MNEWIMAGIVIGGTVLLLGGGGAVARLLKGSKKRDKPSS